MSLNLASQPFVNSRPVRRLVLVLWCLSVVMAAANVYFYARHVSGQEERRDLLGDLGEREREERRRLAELEAQLAAADLEWQNSQVDFLNLRIAERVFPWSLLFDRISEVLPREVRLTRLRPWIDRDDRRREAAPGPPETVQLELRAEARSDEAILELIGNLFEHPAFRSPNLFSEQRRPREQVVEFQLAVTYVLGDLAPAPVEAPPAAPPPAEVTAGDAAGGSAG